MLAIEGLRLALPDGSALFDGLDLRVAAGEIVAVLGPSGSGKTTLLRAIFEPDALIRAGYTLSITKRLAAVPLGLVPQRGAPFDHLDAAGNIRLALRHAEPPVADDDATVQSWLAKLDLPLEWASREVPVAQISGGQAQRLAVARTLAGGRRLLFLDEPSVGLDPLRVRLLGTQLRAIASAGAAIVLVTHDVQLAAQICSRILHITHGVLVPLLETWQNPLDVEEALVRALQTQVTAPSASKLRSSSVGAVIERLLEPLGIAVASLSALPRALRHPRDFVHGFTRVLRLSVVAPLAFFAIVSTLLGFTVLFVIAHVVPEGLSAGAVIRQIGGSYITALAPAISAFLFVAASGSSVNAWIGGMGLTRQIAALEALGIPRDTYLWAPAWLALALGYLLIALVFAFGLLCGGALLCALERIPDGFHILSIDLLHPRPSRVRFLVRALWLCVLYAGGIASDVIAKANREKPSAESVTHAMTSSVVTATLWVVALELASALLLFSAARE